MSLEKIEILNLLINKDNLSTLLEQASKLIEEKEKFYVCAPNAFLTVKANEDKQLLKIINEAAIVVPDGMSSIWVAKKFKSLNLERISGYDFFYEFSKIADKKHLSYFFLGGKNQDVLIKIKNKLKVEFENIDVKGFFSPPFYTNEMPDEVNKSVIKMINDLNPDVLWVGLSSPKQEKWIYENIKKIDIKMACAVGAVFDFYSGEINRAPVWMQKIWLEWLFRMVMEPRRLFKKYLIYNNKFMILVFKDFINKKFKIK